MAALRVVYLLCLLQCTLAFRATVSDHAEQQQKETETQNQTLSLEKMEASGQKQKYYVFVKMIELGGDYYTLGLGYHTETMFCPAPKNQFWDNAVADLFHDKVLNNQKVVTQSEIDTLQEYFPECITTGYAALSPVRQRFDDERPYFFYGTNGKQKLHYVGTTTLNVRDFIMSMRRCGNWEPNFYSLLYHNCNYFTQTIMTAMGFESPTFQVEKMFGGAWIPWQGYVDVADGSFECRGTKCTGRGYQDDEHKDPRAGLCDKGRCWDESEYNPDKHTCASHAGKSIGEWFNFVFSKGEKPVNEAKASKLEHNWPQMIADQPHQDDNDDELEIPSEDGRHTVKKAQGWKTLK